jgi:hypothetical protein
MDNLIELPVTSPCTSPLLSPDGKLAAVYGKLIGSLGKASISVYNIAKGRVVFHVGPVAGCWFDNMAWAPRGCRDGNNILIYKVETYEGVRRDMQVCVLLTQDGQVLRSLQCAQCITAITWESPDTWIVLNKVGRCTQRLRCTRRRLAVTNVNLLPRGTMRSCVCPGGYLIAAARRYTANESYTFLYHVQSRRVVNDVRGSVVRYSYKRKYALFRERNEEQRTMIDLQTGQVVEVPQDDFFPNNNERIFWLNSRFGATHEVWRGGLLTHVELHSDCLRGVKLPRIENMDNSCLANASDHHVAYVVVDEHDESHALLYAPHITLWSRKLHWCLSPDFKRRAFALLCVRQRLWTLRVLPVLPLEMWELIILCMYCPG